MSTHHRPSSRRAPSRVRAAAAAALALAATLAASLVAVVAPTTAHAVTSDDLTWSLSPKDGEQGDGRANFAYAVEPGDRLRDVLVVTNRSATPLDLAVYGTDALTTPSGHLDLLPADQEPTDVGTWLTLETDGGVAIDPGETVEVPFTLEVPQDATPGDHAGGVVTSLRQQVGDGALSVDRRLALRVHARVGGALAPGLAVSDVGVVVHPTANPVGAARATVTYTLTNTGNARLVPTESVRLTGPGASASAGGEPADELLPGAVVRRTVQVDGVRPTFRVTADVRADGLVVGVGGGGATTATGTAAGWAVPWALVGVVVLVVAAAVAWPLWRSRRARRGSSEPREVVANPVR
ncbi:DUF916 domain-containing protein [Isoptericola sp. NPDC019482]|uniref:WxL protein peptidoglycan domain-containing protein n=1 Tax=Isoptericola sp. NPDC019482 TaxID=3154688 RepID=UPI003488D5FD